MKQHLPPAIEAARAAAQPPEGATMHDLESRSLRVAQALANATLSAPEYSLVEYVRSKVPGLYPTDVKGLERVHEISRLAAQVSDSHPDGTWVPFAALAGTRDLDLTSGANTIGAAYGKALVPGIMPVHGLLGSATIITGLRAGTLSLPAIDTAVDPTAGWSASGAATTSEPTFKASRVATPKHLAVELVVSRRLLLTNATRDLEADLRAHILRRVYDQLDRVLLAGNGSAEPLGVLNNTDVPVQALGANGAALAWANVCNLEEAPALAVGELLRPAWVMAPQLRKKLRQTTNPAGDLILPGANLLDVPVAVSTAVPTNLTKGSGTSLTALLYGDAAEVVLGIWGGGIDLLVDPFTYSSRGAIRLIARVECGVVTRRPTALVRCVDINPA